MRNSLTSPVLGGDVRLSRGALMLTPQGTADVEKPGEPQKEDDLVQKAFATLSRKEGIAKQLAKPKVILAGHRR